MNGKPLEFWIALCASTLVVLERNREKPLISRTTIAAISAGLGYSLAPDAAAWSGRSEVFSVMVLTAFGYIALDVVFSVAADRKMWADIIRKRLGGKDD